MTDQRTGRKQAGHPPLTPYLGILFQKSDAKYVSRLSAEKEIAKQIARRIKDDFEAIDFNFAPSVIDLQPFIWEEFTSRVKYTYLLDISNLDAVWEGMDSKKRNDIIRAAKDGVVIEVNCDFNDMFALVEKTFDRQNEKVTFKSAALQYNKVLLEKGLCNSIIAKDRDGNPIASIYIVWDKKRSYLLLAGYDPVNTHRGASACAIWHAIKFTKEELGLNQYDFEGSMLEPVEQFYRKFGGTLTPYYSVSWIAPSVKLALDARSLIGAGLKQIGLRK
ncbi:GNAT family N-acetyltransferase [Candidatus Poribacteria bacterium]|nr:GNAT family N-acetyltransferase [Candidatus Poribacteria bacterium]